MKNTFQREIKKEGNIEDELYTEKMVDFINGFENVGICFEEAGGVIEE